MTDDVPIQTLIQLLAAHWQTRRSNLDDYLRSTFDVATPEPLPTSLHLSQMEDGSIHPQNIGHNFAAVWLIEGVVVREVPVDFEWRSRFETDDSDTYYIRPSYSFVAKGCELLLSERYGPDLKHRSYGRVVAGTAGLSVEWTTLWHTGPENNSGN